MEMKVCRRNQVAVSRKAQVSPRTASSLGSQGLNNVNARGAGGRQRGGGNGGDKKNDRRDDHGQRARHFHVEQIAASETREQVTRNCADRDTRRSYHRAFTDYSSQQTAGLRTNRETNAKLAGSRADGKRQY